MIVRENRKTFRWEWWIEQGPQGHWLYRDRSEFARCVLAYSLEINCGKKARDYACRIHRLDYGVDVIIPSGERK